MEVESIEAMEKVGERARWGSGGVGGGGGAGGRRREKRCIFVLEER